MKLIAATISLLILGSLFMGCSAFGTKPKGDDLKRISESNNYDKKTERFVNRRQDYMDDMVKNANFWEMMKAWYNNKNETIPKKRLPQVTPEVAQFLEPSDKIKIVWLGHSSLLLNMDQKIVLIDPVFSEAASPVSFFGKRFQEPALALKQLPKIDYIIISHDHYDHLDMESIKYFVEKDTKFIVPLGVGSHIKGWGGKTENIIEKDWWQSQAFDGIEFIATPAQHFSGRTGFNGNHTLWASWVIKTPNHKIYYSGDSGYDTHFKDIGDKYGPFDIAFIESGQYNERWEHVHLLPHQSVQAYYDLKAEKFFPIHWGMFELALHPWHEPIDLMYKKYQEKDDFNLVSPKLGEIIEVEDKRMNFLAWWRD